MNFVPISFKSDYSLMKSLLKIKDIVSYAEKEKEKYVGILEDNPYSIMDFYDKCMSYNLKCIFGMIIYVGNNKIYLYIKNYDGYLNILKIHNLILEDKLTFESLIKYNAGLICVLPFENYSLINRLKQAFEVYLGYKNNNEFETAIKITKNILFINEILCLKKEDTNFLKTLYKIDNKEFNLSHYYILPATERDINTIKKFVENINLKFDFTKRYIPAFCKTEEESINTLYTLAKKGLLKRLNGKLNNTYKDRLLYELEVIKNMGFVDYFLIVYDYIKFAKKSNIYVGPGRGSAAGSLVSYSLGIIDVDPIKYNLLFERFLNPDRITMPDIDIDFEDTRRGEVIDYVKKKYRESCVSLIVAYGTLGSRLVIRDVGKVLKIDQPLIDELSKNINPKKSLKENLDNNTLVEFIKNKNLQNLYKISMKLEGIKKHTTIHAAGVIISSTPLKDIIPVFETKDGLLTGFTMEYLEKIGLLKMDFLALRNLSIIHNTVDIIKKNNTSFNLKTIPLNDPNTFKLLSSGKTENIFQFDTPGMKNFIKKLTPKTFDDLTAAIALFRPGPMQFIDEYIERRNGKKFTYLHPDLIEILKSTFGIIIYQEQIMQILSKMAGYTFAEADIIRRAMSKKKKDVMLKEREHFLKESEKRGYNPKISEQVYDMIVKFADYGFNKSHSVSYALIGYQMAYLKANYTEAFHLNTLNMNIGSDAKIKDVIKDARRRGLIIIRPNIIISEEQYIIDSGKLILPLTSIKNISTSQSKIIINNRPYDDYFDFLKKTYNKGLNRNNVETLIKGGALDIFGYSKNTLLSNIDSAVTYLELVENLDSSLIMKPDIEESKIPDEEYSELDIFGFYVSGHPATKYTKNDIVKLNKLHEYLGKRVNIVALVDKVKVIDTKNKEKMAFLGLSDDTINIDSVIFPKNNTILDKLNMEGLNKFRCQITKRNDEIQAVLEEILPIE